MGRAATPNATLLNGLSLLQTMNDSFNTDFTNQVIAIGIQGLPELSANMIPGGLYALKAETPSARYPLLAGSLQSALNSGLTCTVIVPSKPELFVQRIESFGDLDAHHLMSEDRLRIFVTQDEFAKKMFRFGADRFAQELAQFEIPENSFLIFDQADELLSLHDVTLALDQVEALRKWFSQWNLTGLLVFSRTTEEHSETINALMDSLTGIARIGGGKDGLEITFEYWQSPDGTLAAQNYNLKTLETGLYEAYTRVAPATQLMMGGAAPEFREEMEQGEPYFFYMDPELGSLSNQIPGIWKHVGTLMGMHSATHSHRTALSILSFTRDTPLRELAETVHTMRLNLGGRARIVVHEKDASLRYQNEALLLRLGINLVIHKDVPISRVPLLLESLNGQSFNRDVGINFEQALASVLPTRLRGYLPALRFRREVQFILDRAGTLNIPSVLIVAQPMQGISALDVLQNISLTRAGDLNSSDGASCFVFLNACPESVMQATLNKILGCASEDIFENIEFVVKGAEISNRLRLQLGTTEHAEFPDYSSYLGQLSAQDNSETEGSESSDAVPDDTAFNSTAGRGKFMQRKTTRPASKSASPSPKPTPAEATSSAMTSGVHTQEPLIFSYNDSPQVAVSGKKVIPRAKRSSPLVGSKTS